MNDVLIIDTGAANTYSLNKALKYLGYNASISNDPKVVSKSRLLFLPGVGAFDSVMKRIKENKLDVAIHHALEISGSRIFGICLGMQLLCEGSSEGDGSVGLKLVDGFANRLDATSVKVPHVGFNTIIREKPSRLLSGLNDSQSYYFLHSYAIGPQPSGNVVATTIHGQTFASVLEKDDKYFGTQFHPEKSNKAGLQLFANFLKD